MERMQKTIHDVNRLWTPGRGWFGLNSVLLVEDDSVLAFSIEYSLRSEGFAVRGANDLAAARRTFCEGQFDLVLLDVRLPDGNGFEFCREIRQTSQVSIICLTACDEEVNIVTGLDLGADDYITKPFRIRELVSRMKAVLRRKKTADMPEVLFSGDIEVHPLQAKVNKGCQEVVLTALEYRLLLTLIKHPKQILSRNVILEGLWETGGEFVDDNTLSVYIRRLREKIEDDATSPKYIVTARGLGYKWDRDTRGVSILA
jgi:DNA-binding response OmpR family regulator